MKKMKSNVRRQSVTKIKMVKIKFLIYSDGPKVAVRFTVTLNLFRNYILYQKNSNVFITTEQRHISYIIHETTCSGVTSSHLLFHSTIMFVFISHAKYFSLTDETHRPYYVSGTSSPESYTPPGSTTPS